MKKNWMYGLLIAAAMFMCSASYADPFTDTGVSDAGFGQVSALLVTDPPLAPASKPVNDGFAHVAMASGGYGDNETDIGPCMACREAERMQSFVSYFKVTDNRMPAFKVACAVFSELEDIPTKVPIAV